MLSLKWPHGARDPTSSRQRANTQTNKNMQNLQYQLSAFGLGLIILAHTGCSGHAVGEGVAAAGEGRLGTQSPPLAQRTVLAPAENAVDAQTSRDQDGQRPDAVEETTEETQPQYEWPYPDREDIFLPPAQKPVNAAVDRRDDHGVALVGFADVDRQQVLLRVDGIVAPLAVGDSRGELQVVAIDPPEVTLKRGDRRWTERLFDKP